MKKYKPFKSYPSNFMDDERSICKACETVIENRHQQKEHFDHCLMSQMRASLFIKNKEKDVYEKEN